MELKEKVKAAFAKAIGDDQQCEGVRNLNRGWTAKIDGINGAKGSAETLKDNMLNGYYTAPASDGFRPKKTKGKWDLNDCDPFFFPFQSHHLVPEKQLPKHIVSVWLVRNSKKKHKEYRLAEDTDYDTNHALNGFFLPFTSTTYQWSKMKGRKNRQLIRFEMMRRTHRQLHQGAHSKTDYLEELDIETAGYKEMVDVLLGVVAERAEKHVKTCVPCKGKGPKYDVQPSEAVVRQVYRVGKTLQGLIVLNKIFVSRVASTYYAANLKGGKFSHPTTPYI
jgi:hypothetical protein